MKSNIKNIIFYIFFVAILYFFGKTLLSNFQEIKNYDFQINFWYLLLSLISFLVFFYSLGMLWKSLLNSDKVSNIQIHYINAISWISKYIPGKVAMIATKVLYLEKKGVSKKNSFLSCLYEHIFQIISSFILSLPFIIYYFSGTNSSIYVTFSIVFLVVGFIGIHPHIFNKILNILLKLIKKPPLAQKDFLDTKDIIKYTIGYSFSMILKGISFVLLVASITQIGGIQDIVFYTFAWIFAGVIGIISIFAPNGLGVREGVLTLILTLVLPLEIAILISIGSRLWFSLCDGVIGLGILGYKWKK